MSGKYYSKALKNSIEHFKIFKSDSRKNDILTIANIFLVASTGIANNIVTFLGVENIITNTLLSVVLYFSLLVTGVQKYYDFSQSAEKHRMISILYVNLSENIQDKNIPCVYILNQYQMLRAIGPGLVIDLDEPVELNQDEQVNERDTELEFELQRMHSN